MINKYILALVIGLILSNCYLASEMGTAKASIEELGNNQTSIFDRLYTLETGKAPAADEDGN